MEDGSKDLVEADAKVGYKLACGAGVNITAGDSPLIPALVAGVGIKGEDNVPLRPPV